jgi:hypothetical protein
MHSGRRLQHLKEIGPHRARHDVSDVGSAGSR